MRAHRLYHQPVQEIGTYITFYRVSIFEFEEALTVIFCAEGPYDFPLKKLEFVRCDLRDNRIASILPFLQSGKQLGALHVLDNYIVRGVAPLIAVILDRVTIQCLNLVREQFDGEGLSAILSSRHSKCLRKLTLALHDLSRGQMEEIGRFLSRNDIELECLEFGPPPDFENEKMDILFRSLQNNRTIYEAPPFVKHALEINKNCDASTNQKLRTKLQSFYFREEYDLQPFLAMKSVCVPSILEMIANSTINAEGEEEDNLSGLYRFIRNWNFPDLLILRPQPRGIKNMRPQ
mmetsp:Transcript_4692/g.8687  ORF Transcript_4692/g.8687 Transcript_4692/m.8687 type:complete len:291 (-) Transcript_4692:339-1211(-)